MLPIGPLMVEHRQIERMLRLFTQETHRVETAGTADPAFVENATSFFRLYTDRCHHGKEESILFRHLAEKPLSAEHRKTLGELIEEHAWARARVEELDGARQRYPAQPEALEDIRRLLASLADFYPKHIEKEDKHFFIPVMAYFTAREQDALVEKEAEFDQRLFHDWHTDMLARLEKEKPT